MARRPVPIQHRLFIVRADWREMSAYPEVIRDDPTMGAWELLRRNNQYAQDYADWYHRIKDVPPVPFPRMSLDGYFCYPEPLQGMTYEQYRAKHPDNLVLPLQDHIRERWGITCLIDPKLTAAQVATQHPSREQRNRLAWLFACTAPDILNPPTHWPEKNYLTHRSVSMLTSGFCTGTEVMVRFDFTGKFEVQVESLRRQIGAFFEGGTRSGSVVVGRREYANADTTGQQPNSDVLNMENFQAFLAVRPGWNSSPVKTKSLRDVIRMVDLIASLEAGTLEDEIREKYDDFPPAEISDLDLSVDPDRAPIAPFYVQEHQRVRKDLRRALLRHFESRQLDQKELNPREINRLLDHAYQLAADDHTSAARLAQVQHRPAMKKDEEKKSD
ncbi:transcriptional regulator domain-containing protein [Burkholderia arboris]|uniref:transcriptional regulator domain-containing protein n=1 Tax=Burkholderia arboris TaxID=488730 RepID=UPI001CF5B495|nr:hypothetical protein [Burkholderia arboris]MCA8051086.1 hypothetical protein [Burkholderia arboris]